LSLGFPVLPRKAAIFFDRWVIVVVGGCISGQPALDVEAPEM